MSVDITIRQKGLLKKTLPLTVILGEKLQYGAFDGVALEVGKLAENEFVAFHPEHIARGISVVWNEKEKNEVSLRLLNFTSDAEINDLYQMVGRIASHWNCTIEVDGNAVTAEEFQAGQQDMIDFNRRVAKEFLTRSITAKENEDANYTIFCAMWPLVIGPEEAQRFLNDFESFAVWLHDKQKLDAYYANPHFYKTETGIIGMYALTEDTRSIFPVKPYVPLGINNPETGKMLECNNYVVMLYSLTENAVIGQIPVYEKFLDALPSQKVSRYDGNNILIEGLTHAEMKSML